jgi:hypothetical protein
VRKPTWNEGSPVLALVLAGLAFLVSGPIAGIILIAVAVALGISFWTPVGYWLGVTKRESDLSVPAHVDTATLVSAPASSESPAETAQAPVAERIYVSQTPRDLVGLFEVQTGILAQKQADVFYGKWMRLSGRVSSIGPWSGYFSQMTFERRWKDPTVFMMFTDQELVESRLSILRHGDSVTVEGKIERIDPVSVQLTHCRLVGDSSSPE